MTMHVGWRLCVLVSRHAAAGMVAVLCVRETSARRRAQVAMHANSASNGSCIANSCEWLRRRAWLPLDLMTCSHARWRRAGQHHGRLCPKEQRTERAPAEQRDLHVVRTCTHLDVPLYGCHHAWHGCKIQPVGSTACSSRGQPGGRRPVELLIAVGSYFLRAWVLVRCIPLHM